MFLIFVCVVSLHHLFSRFVTFRAHSTTSHRLFNSEFPKNSLKQSSTSTIFTIHQIGMSSRANIIFSLHLLPSSIVRPFHFFLPDFHNACRLLLLLSFALSNNTYHNICYHFSFSHSLSSRGACRSAFRISNTCWVDQETCRMTEIGKKNHWNTFFFLAGVVWWSVLSLAERLLLLANNACDWSPWVSWIWVIFDWVNAKERAPFVIWRDYWIHWCEHHNQSTEVEHLTINNKITTQANNNRRHSTLS